MANLYEPLIYANPPGSAEPFSPALATSWEVSKDGLEWTFHLRQGVTFHDGTPFNAAAVKYSIDRTQEAQPRRRLHLGAREGGPGRRSVHGQVHPLLSRRPRPHRRRQLRARGSSVRPPRARTRSGGMPATKRVPAPGCCSRTSRTRSSCSCATPSGGAGGGTTSSRRSSSRWSPRPVRSGRCSRPVRSTTPASWPATR